MMESKYFTILIIIIILFSLFYLSNKSDKSKQSNVEKYIDNTKDTDLSTQSQDQLISHTAKALVLTCMDFRLLDDVVRYLDKKGYNNNYDQFILAGGSLGYNQNVYDEWKKTLDKHIELSLELHDIKEIIIIDHINCGAYKKFYNKKEFTYNEELSLHEDNINKFKIYVNKQYPTLKVKGFIMMLDGSVISVDKI